MAAPTITAVSPASGPAGTQVVITGTGFTEDTSAVAFAAVSAGTGFAIVSDTKALAYVPTGTGAVHVTLTTPDGTSTETAADVFTYDTYVGPPGGGGGDAPTVTSVVPDTAVDNGGGDTIAVNGTGFTTALAVLFDDVLAQFTVTSDTVLSVTTPAGSGEVDITVVNDFGVSPVDGGEAFTYPAGLIPTITSFTPESGGEWALITITGTNFLTATGGAVVAGVTFVGDGATEIPAVFRAESDTSLIVYVPEGAVTGVITVYSEAGSVASASFTSLGTVYGVIQASANGKNTVHYDSGVPGATANIAGDIWFRYGTGATANQVIEQYVGQGGTSWQAVTMNDAVIATLDCAKLTAGTINVAIELTSATITGGVIRTAASGKRVVLDASASEYIYMYSGGESETIPAEIKAATPGAGGGFVISGPASEGRAGSLLRLNGPHDIALETHEGAAISMNAGIQIDGAAASVDVGETSGIVAVAANLTVTGSIKPAADWASGISEDGIWINDATTAARRWKLYMKNGRLYARYGFGGDEYVTVGP